MLLCVFKGLPADFLLVNTADLTRRTGVGLESNEVRDGGAARDDCSEGVGEKSLVAVTRLSSLSVAEATRRSVPDSSQQEVSEGRDRLLTVGLTDRVFIADWQPRQVWQSARSILLFSRLGRLQFSRKGSSSRRLDGREVSRDHVNRLRLPCLANRL